MSSEPLAAGQEVQPPLGLQGVPVAIVLPPAIATLRAIAADLGSPGVRLPILGSLDSSSSARGA
jgi:hypothetical protein